MVGALLVEYKQYVAHQIPSPVAVLPDGGVYDGEIQKGQFHGKGRLSWPDKSYYEGEFEKGSFHGKGLLHTANFIYEGEFQQGIVKGEGKVVYANGNIYTGQVDLALPEGYGVMELKNGDVYKGEFKQGLYSGYGELVKSSGAVYVGEFKKGLFDGEGVYTQYRQLNNKNTAQKYIDKNAAIKENKIIYSGEFSKGQFSGDGVWIDGDKRYEGEFLDWKFHGDGLYTSENESYAGEFSGGLYHGKGIYKSINGLAYEGQFSLGEFHGKGSLTNEFGDNFNGNFQYGFRHGKGKVTYAQALDDIESYSGVWKRGVLIEASNERVAVTSPQRVEHALYQQASKLQQQLDALDKEDPEKIDMYFVAVAGDGNQAVFRRETEFIRAEFEKNYSAKGKTIILANTRLNYEKYPLATVTSIEDTLRAVSEKMDAENDILFLYLTSHGSSDFYLSLDQPGMNLDDISAKKVGSILKSLPVKHKVIVVSACYSGGFVKPLKDAYSMIITAAEADKVSFGCHDRARMTYFGEAFFKDALPQSSSFVDAFYRSRDIVRGLEAKQGYANSNPLIFKPKAIVAKLKQWRAQLKKNIAEEASLASQ